MKKKAMHHLIVLFNLQSDAEINAYENWAKTTDLPTVKGLSNCAGFDLYKTMGLLGKDEPAPYQYVEHIRISDLDGFGSETQSETMQKVARAFRAFADQPVFMLCEQIGS